MRHYKQQLQRCALLQGTKSTYAYTPQLDALLSLLSAMHARHEAINRIVIAQLDEETCCDNDDPGLGETAESKIRQTHEQCTKAWDKTKDAMRHLRFACDDTLFRKAELFYGASKSWADDVVDGLWPSTHLGADDHNDVWECEDALLEYTSEDLEINYEELCFRVSKEWRESSITLGGTGRDTAKS
jgi:hypothetical protein